MKNFFQKKSVIICWYAFLLTILFMTSCGTLKKKQIKTTDTKTTTLFERKTDSSNVVEKSVKETKEVSGAIEKENQVSLMTTDSLVNAKINTALRNFRYYDRSGRNSVKAEYDEEKMILLFKSYIDETISDKTDTTTDTTTETNTETSSVKTFEQNVDDYLEKVKLPWWFYGLGLFLVRNHIIAIIGFFIPGIHSVKTARDLFKKPETN